MFVNHSVQPYYRPQVDFSVVEVTRLGHKAAGTAVAVVGRRASRSKYAVLWCCLLQVTRCTMTIWVEVTKRIHTDNGDDSSRANTLVQEIDSSKTSSSVSWLQVSSAL